MTSTKPPTKATASKKKGEFNNKEKQQQLQQFTWETVCRLVYQPLFPIRRFCAHPLGFCAHPLGIELTFHEQTPLILFCLVFV